MGKAKNAKGVTGVREKSVAKKKEDLSRKKKHGEQGESGDAVRAAAGPGRKREQMNSQPTEKLS